MQTFNSKLSNFPRTLAFVVQVFSTLKNEPIDYFIEELNDATITDKCPCGRCFSFTLKTPKKYFVDNSACVGNFGDVLVVLRDNDGYLEVEIPQNMVVPFADDFNVFQNGVSPLMESVKEAHDVVKQWFIQNGADDLCVEIVD
jgi:hypothetical protein